MNSLWLRRLLNPKETARVLAPRYLSFGMRQRLLRLYRLVAREKPGSWEPIDEVSRDWLRELESREGRTTCPGEAASPLVSIGIVTFNNVHLTRLCLTSLFLETHYRPFEVIVVDNASSDSTREFLESFAARYPAVRLAFNSTNRGFAAANNQAIELSRGDFFCFLNNDIVLTRSWLTTLVETLLERPHAGLSGPVTNAIGNEARIPVTYRTYGEMQAFSEKNAAEKSGHVLNLPMLALFCAVMPRRVWETVGLLDERFGTGMFEDDDFCKRLHTAGYSLLCRQDAFVHHWQRAGFRALGEERYRLLYEENRRLFEHKWRR